MKLLLDENISFRVAQSLAQIFPGSIHISDQQPQLKEDQQIFDFAKAHDFTIVNFDEDFYALQLLKGYPPKIVWLRFGNSSNLRVVNKLIENQEAIISFLENPDRDLLNNYDNTRIPRTS